jgi:hypothetical protein
MAIDEQSDPSVIRDLMRVIAAPALLFDQLPIGVGTHIGAAGRNVLNASCPYSGCVIALIVLA